MIGRLASVFGTVVPVVAYLAGVAALLFRARFGPR